MEVLFQLLIFSNELTKVISRGGGQGRTEELLKV